MRITFLLIFILFTTKLITAQDVITKRTGEEIEVKVLEVNINDIKYIKYSNLDGPKYTILKEEIFMIKYENGEKEVYSDYKTTETEKEISFRVGANAFLGASKLKLDDRYSSYTTSHPGFSYAIDLDFIVYFNNIVGLKTGITLGKDIAYITYNYNNIPNENIYLKYYSIPFKLVLSTEKQKGVGFYSEFGPELYKVYGDTKQDLKFEVGIVAGLNIFLNEDFLLYVAPSFDYVFGESDWDLYRFGGQIGFHYRL